MMGPDKLGDEVLMSPPRYNSPLARPGAWESDADESEAPPSSRGSGRSGSGSARRRRWPAQHASESAVVASVVSHRRAPGGSYTVYDIVVNARHGAGNVSAWRVCRRYSAFHKLHQELKAVSFPTPELPPKALLWASFASSGFLDQRKAALHVWLQGCLCIWQQVRIDDVRASYEVAELLEAFLCEEDALADARARGLSSPFQHVKAPREAGQVRLPEDAGSSERVGVGVGVGASSLANLLAGKVPSAGAGAAGATLAGVASAAGVAVSGSPSAATSASGGAGAAGAAAGATSASSSLAAGSPVGGPPQPQPQPQLQPQPQPQPQPPNERESRALEERRLQAQSLWRQLQPTRSRVGVADISYASQLEEPLRHQSFTTYNLDGKSVEQTFRPFTATVRIDGTGSSAAASAAARDEEVALHQSLGSFRDNNNNTNNNTASCTPVSVPPTPDGQHEFLNSWSRYTETVLEYVADRLDGPRGVNYQGGGRGNDGGNRIRGISGCGNSNSNSNSSSSNSNSSSSSSMSSVASAGATHSTPGSQLLPGTSQDNELDEYGGGAAHAGAAADSGDLLELEPRASKVRMSSSGTSQGQSQAAGDTTGPNRRRERIERHGAKLVRRLVHEAGNAVDFVGSSWEFLGKMKGVLLMRKQQQQQDGKAPLHCFMGRGTMACSARDAFELVRDPARRDVYDRMVRAGSHRVVEALDDACGALVVHHLFESKQRLWFLTYSRDFCVLQFAKELDDGRFCVVGTSVRHNDCPPQEGVVRAKIGIFGWLIEPLADDTCKATYLVKVDFGGNVPVKFLESMSVRQPMCVRYVEDYLVAERHKKRHEAIAAAALAQPQPEPQRQPELRATLLETPDEAAQPQKDRQRQRRDTKKAAHDVRGDELDDDTESTNELSLSDIE